jgi:hypothetical protein
MESVVIDKKSRLKVMNYLSIKQLIIVLKNSKSTKAILRILAKTLSFNYKKS